MFFATFLKSLWRCSGEKLGAVGMHWRRTGDALGAHWGRTGDVWGTHLGMYWGRIGNNLEFIQKFQIFPKKSKLSQKIR